MLNRPNLAQPLCHKESATSYVSRLTCYVCVDTPFDLCLDLGLEWQAVVRGEVIQLKALAALGGANESDLLRWTIRSLGGLQFMIGGDEVPNKTLLRSQTRLCPRCVIEALVAGEMPFCRFHWNLRAIRKCEIHRVPIIQLPHLEHTFGDYDFVRRVEACRDQIASAARADAERPFTAYETYLIARLRGHSCRVPFADTLSLGTLCWLSESLGLALLKNRTPLFQLTDDDLYQAGTVSFSYVKRGEAGLQDALADMQVDPLQNNARHELAYGAFCASLRIAPETGEIDAIRHPVREFVFSNYPIQKGTEVLGVRCPETRVYSVNSAKMEHGISCKRFVWCLVEFGAAERQIGNKEGLVLKRHITADDIVRIVNHRDDLVNRWEAAAILGGSDTAFRQLRLEGRVKQLWTASTGVRCSILRRSTSS